MKFIFAIALLFSFASCYNQKIIADERNNPDFLFQKIRVDSLGETVMATRLVRSYRLGESWLIIGKVKPDCINFIKWSEGGVNSLSFLEDNTAVLFTVDAGDKQAVESACKFYIEDRIKCK